MAWPEPALDDGLEDGLLRPELLELPESLELDPDELDRDEPELELEEPDPNELEEPEPDEPEELEEPEPEEPEPELVPVLADPWPALAELVAAPLDEPGRASATAPAASTLATPTVAVVAVTRVLPRWRAATASRFRLFMT